MSINWHTLSHGPKKKSIEITKRRIDSCPAHTACSKGSFTTMVLWTVQRFLSSTELSIIEFMKNNVATVVLHFKNEPCNSLNHNLSQNIKRPNFVSFVEFVKINFKLRL